MILEFSGIVSKGKSDEALIFNVLADGNLEHHAVFDECFAEHPVRRGRVFYKFHDHTVRKFDTVILYTSGGVDRKVQDQQIELHKFYMNLPSPVWVHRGDRVFLVEIADFEYLAV